MTDFTDLKAKAREVARQWLEHGAEYQSTGPHETPVITDMLVNLIEAALIAEREADAAWMAEARRLLGDARDLVEKWCHYQGNTPALFDQYLGPIDAFLAKSPQSDKEA